MCVANPMRVARVDGDRATMALGTTELEASIELLDDVKVGDYLIVHAGFAIQKLDCAEAEETIRLLDAMARSGGVDPPG